MPWTGSRPVPANLADWSIAGPWRLPKAFKGIRMKTERQRAWRRGRTAERLAILALTLTGYRIVARNLKIGLGESVIVARRGRVIAFIEVKSRADWGRAAESILVRQRQRIARAASTFLAA